MTRNILSIDIVFGYILFHQKFSLLFQVQRGFPGDSAGKKSTCNVEDLGSIPGLGRLPGETWRILWTVQSMRVTKSQT